jgi:hypothetical protein
LGAACAAGLGAGAAGTAGALVGGLTVSATEASLGSITD